MAEAESAEELVYRLDTLGATSQAAIVRERDTAIREASKLELLEEIRQYADVLPGSGDKRYAALLDFLQSKYSATPSGSSGGGENG